MSPQPEATPGPANPSDFLGSHSIPSALRPKLILPVQYTNFHLPAHSRSTMNINELKLLESKDRVLIYVPGLFGMLINACSWAVRLPHTENMKQPGRRRRQCQEVGLEARSGTGRPSQGGPTWSHTMAQQPERLLKRPALCLLPQLRTPGCTCPPSQPLPCPVSAEQTFSWWTMLKPEPAVGEKPQRGKMVVCQVMLFKARIWKV